MLNKQFIAGEQYDGDFEIITVRRMAQGSIVKREGSNDEWVLI